MAIEAGQHEQTGAEEAASNLAVCGDTGLCLDVRVVGIKEEVDAEDHAEDRGGDCARPVSV